jgi:hypothetical protein
MSLSMPPALPLQARVVAKSTQPATLAPSKASAPPKITRQVAQPVKAQRLVVPPKVGFGALVGAAYAALPVTVLVAVGQLAAAFGGVAGSGLVHGIAMIAAFAGAGALIGGARAGLEAESSAPKTRDGVRPR